MVKHATTTEPRHDWRAALDGLRERLQLENRQSRVDLVDRTPDHRIRIGKIATPSDEHDEPAGRGLPAL